jgi:hypothetical protein
MIQAALSSAALPGVNPDTFLRIAREAGVGGVEWASGTSLKPGDTVEAGNLMMRTLRAGLSTVSYASPFRFGIHDHGSFTEVLQTAAVLYSPLVRVWTGPRGVGTGTIDKSGRPCSGFSAEILRLADRAGNQGISLCFSFAKASLLDSYESAIRLFDALDHPFVKLVWEPLEGCGFDASREAFAALSGRIGLMLARSSPVPGLTGTLAENEEEWLEYLDAYDEQGGSPDMLRHVVIDSFGQAAPGAQDQPGLHGQQEPQGGQELPESYAQLRHDSLLVASWSRQLRQHHRRRIF